MSKQITIVNNENQESVVDLICYFQNNNNNKKYQFYTKNEVVQDGLIKIYVAEESNGMTTEITPDEWNEIKVIMQNIIKGTVNNITFLPTQDKIKIGGEKVIALNQNNIDLLDKGYNNDPKIIGSENAVSNADLLTQNFSTIPTDNNTQVENNEVVAAEPAVPTNTEIPSTPPVEENVIQITAIPAVTNPVNLEVNPVNLSMEAPVENAPVNANPMETNMDPLNNTNLTLEPLPSAENKMPEIPSIENKMPEIPSIENVGAPVSTDAPVPEASTINESAPDITIPEVPSVPDVPSATPENISSPFQVSSAPNIFDQMPQAPQVVTNPIEIPGSEVSTVEDKKEEAGDIFSAPQAPTEIKTENTSNNMNSEIDKDILAAEIALEKEAAELYEKLANNSRKKIELLEQKRKIEDKPLEQTNTNNEPSASELFNSNGTLNDNKVLELSPIPGMGLAA